MDCEKCGQPSIVKDSRPTRAIYARLAVRRRRRCTVCEHRFTTFELSLDSIESMRDPPLALPERVKLRAWLNRFPDMPQ